MLSISALFASKPNRENCWKSLSKLLHTSLSCVALNPALNKKVCCTTGETSHFFSFFTFKWVSEWLIVCVSEWVCEWMNEWVWVRVNERVSVCEWMNEWENQWLCERVCVSEWVSEWASVWMNEWVSVRMCVRVIVKGWEMRNRIRGEQGERSEGLSENVIVNGIWFRHIVQLLVWIAGLDSSLILFNVWSVINKIFFGE